MKKEEQLIELIEKSGNTFHYKVVNFLRGKEWFVRVSPYYNDNLTDKPREIDIIAEKSFGVYFFQDYIGTVNVKLFIECKFINSDTIFWFDNKDKEKAIERAMVDTGLDGPDKNTKIQSHRSMRNNEIAKLFVSSKEKAQENEVVYKALNQGLNAMVYYKNTGSIIPGSGYKKIFRTLNYPIIMCSDFNSFYQVKAVDENQSIPKKIEDSFQFEINYAYVDKDKKNKTEYFLVDIVDFNKFEEFLKDIESSDIDAVKRNSESEYVIQRSESQQNKNFFN